ncbi:TetR/AcrR family transcriptional regulator [Mycolicibacterium sp. 018/SC-01/001]|nr:TetR/AcrR family transcriptional regulator [Mycolicibacterium sp. 018/SC-01/001]
MAAAGTRERILDAASTLFYRHGVRAVGMNRIISEAGTGKNLLYTHFSHKADLASAYLERVAAQRAAALKHARRGAGDDPRAALVAIVEETAKTVRENDFRGCAFRMYLAEFPDEPAQDSTGGLSPAGVARRVLLAARSEIDVLAARAVGSGPDAEQLAEQVWLLVDGLYQQAAYRDRTDDGADRGAAAAVTLAKALVDGA